MYYTFMEFIGYLASFIILLSFLTSSVIRLRIINFIGCALFVIYGVFINAYPVAIINGIIAVIQIVFIFRMLKQKADYRIVKCLITDKFLQDFINVHIHDIEKFLPTFNFSCIPDDAICYFCMINEELAGLWIGIQTEATLNVVLDYVKPKFRDCRMGRYIYRENVYMFRHDGINLFETSSFSDIHTAYLLKIGFEKTSVSGKYILRVS